MKRIQKIDLLFVALQFLLFALFFINKRFFDFDRPNSLFVDIPAILIMLCGIIVIVMAIVNLNENLTPFPTPKENASLVMTGVYHYLRHPIYTGILLAMTGYTIYTLSVERLLFTIAMFVVFHYKSKLEEELLFEKFPHYEDYMARTGRFIPRFRSK